MASGALLPLAFHLPLQALEQVDPRIPTVAASSLPVAPPPVGLPQITTPSELPSAAATHSRSGGW